MHTSFRSITLPHLPDDHGYYERIDDLWNNITTKYAGNNFLIQSTLAYQPWPRSIGKATEARGGNAMGLTAKDKDRFIIEIAGIYMRAADSKTVLDMSREFTDTLQKQLETMKTRVKAAGGPMFETYLPEFMNDAAVDQDVVSTYKDKKLFAKLQKQMDPEGFWTKRTAGYKYDHTEL